MIRAFDKLSNSEVEVMLKAPLLTCILIAGADGKIDRKEVRSAFEFATKKQKNAKSGIVDFYREVGEDFEDKFKFVFQAYPTKVADRTSMIVSELAKLNDILPKLDTDFAKDFYNSIREIASGTAHSSGGLLGMNKVGNEEAQYLGLSMIKEPS